MNKKSSKVVGYHSLLNELENRIVYLEKVSITQRKIWYNTVTKYYCIEPTMEYEYKPRDEFYVELPFKACVIETHYTDNELESISEKLSYDMDKLRGSGRIEVTDKDTLIQINDKLIEDRGGDK